jgi:hypothetical protein
MTTRLYPPEEDDYCVCSVLQSILRKYEVEMSQEEIARNLTPDDSGFRVDDSRIRRFMESNGLDYGWRWHDMISLRDLNSFLEDMDRESGIVGINEHLYLLGRFEKPMLELIDPMDERVRSEELFSLLRRMDKTKGLFGLIRPSYITNNE